MNRKDGLTVLGMALYCGVVFCAFLAYGTHSEAMETVVPAAAQGCPYVSKERPPVELGDSAIQMTDSRAREATGRNGDSSRQGETGIGSRESDEVNVMENCTITYYCAERYAHICGTGDGVTATGAEAVPGVTCAVDPSVIPYGSVVMIDYGDGELHTYVAEDAGAWVNQAHVDICVESHDQALELGKKSATVYWVPPEGEA